MNEVVEILKIYVQAIGAAKSPQIVVAKIRSFAQYLKSPILQPILILLKEQKYDDLKRFQKEFIAFQDDKKRAFETINELVRNTPFLQKHLEP